MHYRLVTSERTNDSYLRQILADGHPVTPWQHYSDCHRFLVDIIAPEDTYTEDCSPGISLTGTEFVANYRRIHGS